ncbi:MAG: metallophosphoesterase [Pseudomonadota bacterium]
MKCRPSFLSIALVFALLAGACSTSGGGAAPDDQATPPDDISVDLVEPPVDVKPADVVEPIEALPTTLLKGPWLQWVTPERFHVMAESEDEVPLVLEVYVDGALRTTVTTVPVKPDYSDQLIPLPAPDGFVHWAEVTGVLPGENFEVLVVNTQDTATGWVPETGTPVSLVLFGDTRTNHEAHQMVVDAIAATGPAMVLHTGDLMSSAADIAKWQEFFDIEQELLSNTFYYPIFGNHEAFGQAYFDTFFHTENNYKNERNWSTIWGDFGFLGIDIFSNDWSDTEALAWMDQELSRLRENAQWVIVAFHGPMYTFSNHGPWLKGREHVLPLLEQHQVDLVVNGHNHCYEHFLVNGIHHVVSGGGGAPLYGFDAGPPEEQALLVKHHKDFHYVKVDMQPEQITFTAILAETGEVIDTWMIP